jgi:hypothetical protein
MTRQDREPSEAERATGLGTQSKASDLSRSAHWEADGPMEWDFVDDTTGKVIGHVRRIGGSWMLNYRGEDIAVRPDLEWAKASMESFHGHHPREVLGG